MIESIISISAIVDSIALCWIFLLLAIALTAALIGWAKNTIAYNKSRRNKE